jgi:hypothetical protein
LRYPVGTGLAFTRSHLFEEVAHLMSAKQQGIVSAPATAGTVPRQPGAVASGGLAFVTVLPSVAAVGGFLFGFNTGVINGAVDALADAFGTMRRKARRWNRCRMTPRTSAVRRRTKRFAYSHSLERR